MRIYKVTGVTPEGSTFNKWSGNQEAAASDRQEMRSAGVRNKDIHTHSIDFVQTKAGIIKMLNDYANT